MKRTMIPLALVAAVSVAAFAGEGQPMRPKPDGSPKVSSAQPEQRTHFSFEKRGKLICGGDDFHGAMWGSNNAIDWDKLQVFDSIEGHGVEGNRIVRRRAVAPNSIMDLGNGEYVAICSIGHRSSGGRARVLEFYEIYLAADGKSLTREARKVLSNGPAGSYDAEELDGATTVVVGDTWHLLYVGTTGKARENTVLGAVGSLDASAPKSPKFPPEAQSRDLR